MKHFQSFTALCLLTFSINLQSSAQQTGLKESMNQLDDFLNTYFSTSSFTEIGSNSFSDSQAKAFRELFSSNALIFDDITAQIIEDNSGSPYKLRAKPVDEYLEDIQKTFPGGLNIKVTNTAIDYTQYNSGKIKMVISRVVKAKSITKSRFENQDTLLIEISHNSQGKFTIDKISSIASHFICLNDKDGDGILDDMDLCPDKAGPLRYNGCPDSDGDRIPDNKDYCPLVWGTEFNKGCPSTQLITHSAVTLYTSLGMNSFNVTLPEASFDYFNIDKEKTEMGNIKQDAGPTSSLLSGIELETTINTKKSVSLGIGIMYNKFTNSSNWTNLKTEFQSRDADSTPYRQILRIHNTAESYNLIMMSLPILFKIKSKFSEKMGYYFEFGPVVHYLKIDAKSTAKITKEAIYSYTNPSWQYPTEISHSEWLITKDQVSTYGDPGTYFQQLESQGYDVTFEKLTETTSQSFSYLGVGGLARAGIMYFVNPAISLIAGPYYQYYYVSQSIKPDNYKPVEKINGKNQYYSVLNGTKSVSGQGFGFLLGVKFGFGK